jgi:diacylglycerol kinase family enzyme
MAHDWRVRFSNRPFRVKHFQTTRIVASERSKSVARIRIILHGKAAGNSGLRTAVHDLRQDGHSVEVRVTWEPGDTARMTAEAVSEASRGNIDCIVAGGGDGTINEVLRGEIDTRVEQAA